jgi:hypothetical protein
MINDPNVPALHSLKEVLFADRNQFLFLEQNIRMGHDILQYLYQNFHGLDELVQTTLMY